MTKKELFFTPGPGALHPEMPSFMNDALRLNIGSLSHRSKTFESLFDDTSAGLKELLGAPDDMQMFLLGSATEAMERIIQNCCARRSFHFVNGAFSQRFLETAQELGRETDVVKSPEGSAFDFVNAQIPTEAELICATHNETSTGVMIDLEALAALKKKHPKKLLALDVVSSAPYGDIPWDAVDAAFFSVQKCFGLPAGLGVLFVNDFCLEKSSDILRAGQSVGSYHNFPTLYSFAQKHQTPETPNVLGLYLLSRVVADYQKRGRKSINEALASRAAQIYEFLEKHASLAPFVKDRRARSATVITVETSDASALLKRLSADGIHLGSGYGKLKDQQVRIANFPVHSDEEIERLSSALS